MLLAQEHIGTDIFPSWKFSTLNNDLEKTFFANKDENDHNFMQEINTILKKQDLTGFSTGDNISIFESSNTRKDIFLSILDLVSDYTGLDIETSQNTANIMNLPANTPVGGWNLNSANFGYRHPLMSYLLELTAEQVKNDLNRDLLLIKNRSSDWNTSRVNTGDKNNNLDGNEEKKIQTQFLSLENLLTQPFPNIIYQTKYEQNLIQRKNHKFWQNNFYPLINNEQDNFCGQFINKNERFLTPRSNRNNQTIFPTIFTQFPLSIKRPRYEYVTNIISPNQVKRGLCSYRISQNSILGEKNKIFIRDNIFNNFDKIRIKNSQKFQNHKTIQNTRPNPPSPFFKIPFPIILLPQQALRPSSFIGATNPTPPSIRQLYTQSPLITSPTRLNLENRLYGTDSLFNRMLLLKLQCILYPKNLWNEKNGNFCNLFEPFETVPNLTKKNLKNNEIFLSNRNDNIGFNNTVNYRNIPLPLGTYGLLDRTMFPFDRFKPIDVTLIEQNYKCNKNIANQQEILRNVVITVDEKVNTLISNSKKILDQKFNQIQTKNLEQKLVQNNLLLTAPNDKRFDDIDKDKINESKLSNDQMDLILNEVQRELNQNDKINEQILKEKISAKILQKFPNKKLISLTYENLPKLILMLLNIVVFIHLSI
jgi:hypothetical protein